MVVYHGIRKGDSKFERVSTLPLIYRSFKKLKISNVRLHLLRESLGPHASGECRIKANIFSGLIHGAKIHIHTQN